MKEYIIDGVKFTQDEITAKQYSRILKMLKNDIQSAGGSADDFSNILGEHIVDFLDVILKCEDQGVKKKSFIEDHFKLSDIKEVVEDFFTYNDLFGIIIEAGKSLQKSVDNHIKA